MLLVSAGEMYSRVSVECTKDQRSFWSWFDVNLSTFHEHIREKKIFAFSFPVVLTFFDVLTSNLFSKLVVLWVVSPPDLKFLGIPVSRNRGRTDGRGATIYVAFHKRPYIIIMLMVQLIKYIMYRILRQ